MAKTIRNTPILYGEDARRFSEEIASLPPAEERRKARVNVREGAERFKKITQGIGSKWIILSLFY